MEALRKIYELIVKDTGGKNESLRLVFVTRFVCLVAILHSVLMLVFDITLFKAQSIMVFAAFLILYSLIMVSSYRYKFVSILWMLNAVSIIAVLVYLRLLGWGTGVQQVLIVMLIICFFSSYRNMRFKIIYAILLLIYRILLQTLICNAPAIITVSVENELIFQIANSAAIYLCVGIICFVYSRDSQRSEGKLMEYNVQLETQANTDPLTGLYNRRRATELLKKQMENTDSVGLCVSICDIDFFKKVNDNYGHDIGDEVLRTLARTMQSTFNEDGTIIARWGGEEFLIVFPNCNGDMARIKLDKLRDAVKQLKFEIMGRSFGITLTFGVSEYDFRSDDKTLIKEADEKLYYGKGNGRDQIVF